MEFFRFPRTPHLAWLGTESPRSDKVLTETERVTFLDQPILVEEKVDGTNLGISLSRDHGVQIQHRGEYLGRESAHPQFKQLWSWLALREQNLVDELGENLMLFGEWCFAVHSVRYDQLPDWFLGFDVYDRLQGLFWSSKPRNKLLSSIGIFSVPRIGCGRYSLDELTSLLSDRPSQLGAPRAEGLYLRCEDSRWLRGRAKLVRREFAQGIDQHWSLRSLRKNNLTDQRRNGVDTVAAAGPR